MHLFPENIFPYLYTFIFLQWLYHTVESVTFELDITVWARKNAFYKAILQKNYVQKSDDGRKMIIHGWNASEKRGWRVELFLVRSFENFFECSRIFWIFQNLFESFKNFLNPSIYFWILQIIFESFKLFLNPSKSFCILKILLNPSGSLSFFWNLLKPFEPFKIFCDYSCPF